MVQLNGTLGQIHEQRPYPRDKASEATAMHISKTQSDSWHPDKLRAKWHDGDRLWLLAGLTQHLTLIATNRPPADGGYTMTKIDLKKTDLDTVIENAQHERLIITRDGKPVALVVGVEGLDEEQLELGSSDKFWTLIEERRRQKTISRAELTQKLKHKK